MTNKASGRPASEIISIDELDRMILRILQRDARATRQAIAKRLGLSKSAVQYRIAKLEDSGIIEGYHARISASALGKNFQIVTLVRAKHAPAYHDKLGAKLAALPGVWAVYFTSGENDFVLLTRGTAKEDLMRSIENMTQIKGIERTVSQLVVKTIKEDPLIEV